jgi:transcriptional regulator with XRE-family HTH domain
MGERLGVHGVTYGGWESGKSQPSLDMIAQLGKLLEVSPAWLAFGEGEAHPTAHPERPRAALPPLEEPDIIEARHESRATPGKRRKRAG